MADWKFHLATFGCKINQYETQAISEAWRNAGGAETANPSEADYICINSCAITANAEREARNALYRLKKLAPRAQIILTGCAAQFFPDFRPRRDGNAAKPDFIIPQKDKDRLYQNPANLGRSSPDQCPAPLPRFSKARPIIKIQDGCVRNCSYCIIPQTRSKSTSRDGNAILEECRALLANGFSELVISGVNLLQYKTDSPDFTGFWELMEFLARNLRSEYGGLFRLRISSLDPAMLTDKALAVILENQEICRHLHLSLQHASEKILHAMRRSHYNPHKILEKITILRKSGPFGLGADFLLGFPGETEDDVKILEDYCKEGGFSYAHIFPFSARPNTPAQKFASQLPFSVKKERAGRIARIIAQGKSEFLKKQLLLDKCFFVGANARDNKTVKGVNEYYVSCRIKGFSGHIPGKKIIPVRPLRVANDFLEVTII